MTATDNNSKLPLESSIEDIIDTWGPGVLIPDSEPTSGQHTLYDQTFKFVLIAGGTSHMILLQNLTFLGRGGLCTIGVDSMN